MYCIKCKLEELKEMFPNLIITENIDKTLEIVYSFHVKTDEEKSKVNQLFEHLPDYLLVKECCGTVPYLTEKLEQTVKDITRYSIILETEKEERNILKVIAKSKSKSLLDETRYLYEMENYFNEF